LPRAFTSSIVPATAADAARPATVNAPKITDFFHFYLFLVLFHSNKFIIGHPQAYDFGRPSPISASICSNSVGNVKNFIALT
jgi:hypothetical protein